MHLKSLLKSMLVRLFLKMMNECPTQKLLQWNILKKLQMMRTILYKLDSKQMILNSTLQNIMVQLSCFRYENNPIDNMQMRINHIYTTIYALKKDIDALYEYMRVLSTQQLNPLIMTPDILCRVLNQVKDGIHLNA